MATTELPIAVGVFRDHHLAEQAVKELRHAQFRDDEISVFRPAAGTGGFLGSVAGRLSGNDAGSTTISDTLISQGMSKEDAAYYQDQLNAGNSLIMVESYGHQQEAKDILYQHGAYDFTETATRARFLAGNRTDRLEDTQTIPIREEVLQVQKLPVEVGQVYLRKRVVTEEKTITVSVTREEIVIERYDVSDQGAPPQQFDGKVIELAEGETIVIPIREEQVIIQKQPVVAEVLVIGKRTIEETRSFTDTVQREVPYIERDGDVHVESKGVEEM